MSDRVEKKPEIVLDCGCVEGLEWNRCVDAHREAGYRKVPSVEKIQDCIMKWHKTHAGYFTTNKIVDDITLASALRKMMMEVGK